jgi:hypothetical protein
MILTIALLSIHGGFRSWKYPSTELVLDVCSALEWLHWFSYHFSMPQIPKPLNSFSFSCSFFDEFQTFSYRVLIFSTVSFRNTRHCINNLTRTSNYVEWLMACLPISGLDQVLEDCPETPLLWDGHMIVWNRIFMEKEKRKC